MDPNSSTPLDPKLQEAYNKVMGTQVPPIVPADTTPLATPPQTTPDIPVTSSIPSTPPVMPSDPMSAATMPANSLPTPTEPLPTPATNSAPAMETVSVGNAPTISYDNVTPAQGFSADKKKMKISPVILVIGGIVFLIVYSLVWIKVFNLQVPYINP